MGLDDKNGPERSISTGSNSQRTPVFPAILLGGETLQFPMPSIRPVISTMGVYKAPETSDGPPQTDRPTPDNLPRRMLFMHTSKEQLEVMAPLIVNLFEALSLMVNKTKSLQTPTQSIEFLGFLINSHTLRLTFPTEKGRKIQQEATKLLQRQVLSARELAMFSGKVTATSRAVWQGCLQSLDWTSGLD